MPKLPWRIHIYRYKSDRKVTAAMYRPWRLWPFRSVHWTHVHTVDSFTTHIDPDHDAVLSLMERIPAGVPGYVIIDSEPERWDNWDTDDLVAVEVRP